MTEIANRGSIAPPGNAPAIEPDGTTAASATRVEAPSAGPAPAPAPPAAGPDKRYLALRNFAVSISVLNVLGYTVLGFEQPWLWPILAVAAGYVTDLVLETVSAWAYHRRPGYLGGPRKMVEFLLPAHITALACNMLVYANSLLWPVLFTVVVAVGQKYVLRTMIRGRMRHFMNPSNFGITVSLLLFSWISIAPPYEFTEYAGGFFRWVIPGLILVAGTAINGMLTGKLPLIAGWVLSFAAQALLRHWFFDAALVSALAVMTGVAFILFTNYMITDPGTTPVLPRHQFVFGASVGLVYGILMVFNVVYTLFFAVTVVCLLRGLGWTVVSYRRHARQRAAALTEGTAS
ncbi:enediyne biosynthesis protein [Amycolatopsis sp. NPDC059090]|uniref:enediyne biosynthesis protein n=1 Tax=unclassified Amycolatopsis TaxID=2618356 RepID=UPI0036724F61